MKRIKIPGHPALMGISLVLGFLIWLAVINISDPIDYRTISGVPVTFTNVSYIEGNGQSYEVVDGFETVSVRVYSSRSVREKITASNITVTADLTQIIDLNSDPILVPVTVAVPGVSADHVVVTPRNIQIRLEDMKSKDFVISATTGDTTPENGYEVGTMDTDPEQITIRGSESLVDKIDRVNAKVDVSNLSADADLPAQLQIFDKNGDELTDSQKSYLTFSVPEEDISVHVSLYRVDTDVQVTVETYGSPSDNYQVGDITLTPSSLQVVGDEDSLTEFIANGNRITIDRASKAVDVSGATSDVTARVDITEFLPEGIRLAENISNIVVVDVKILPYGSRSYSLDVKNIQKNNLDDGLSAVFALSELDIRVMGDDDNLANLDTSSIRASVDLSGLTEGTHVVPVTITLPSDYSLVEDVEAEIVISKTTTDTE